MNQLFGFNSGLGLSVITFDWGQIAYLGSPLVTPWWAEVNIFVGFVLAYCIFSPALYYTNVSLLECLPACQLIASIVSTATDLVFCLHATGQLRRIRSIWQQVQHQLSPRHGISISECHCVY